MMYYSVNDTGKLGKRKSERFYQESNLRPSDYQFRPVKTQNPKLFLQYRVVVFIAIKKCKK